MHKPYSDCEQEAKRIYSKLGKIDGKKHLDQILYFVNSMNSSTLVEYWMNVNIYFNEKV